MSETITFFNARDEEIEFTSSYADLLWGISGRMMPKVTFVEEETPQREGARIRRMKVPPREVAIPVAFKGTSSTELRAQLRTVARRLWPTADGRLQVSGPDGATRELVCRYSGGMEGDETPDNGGTIGLKVLFVFRAAEDPYWRDLTATEVEFTTGEPDSWFPIFPLSLAESSIFGGITIGNAGDVDAWPIWTITGPGGPLTLTNETTGEALALSTVLAAGETITIDTTPGVKTIVKNDGSNLYTDLGDDRDLFPLVPGDNNITVELISSTVDSQVAISYRARYLLP